MPSSQHVFSIKLNSPWPMPKSRDIARPYHLLFSTKLFLNNNRQQVLTFMKGYGFKDSCSQQICSCRKPPADGFSCPEFLEWHADLGPSKPTDPGFNNHYEQPLPLATASLKTHILKSYPRFSGGVVVWMMSWTYKSQVTLIAKVIMCGPWFSAIFGGILNTPASKWPAKKTEDPLETRSWTKLLLAGAPRGIGAVEIGWNRVYQWLSAFMVIRLFPSFFHGISLARFWPLLTWLIREAAEYEEWKPHALISYWAQKMFRWDAA